MTVTHSDSGLTDVAWINIDGTSGTFTLPDRCFTAVPDDYKVVFYSE